MTLPAYICGTCHDIGTITRPSPLGKSWCRPCPNCGDVYPTAAHVAKVYRRMANLPGPDGQNAKNWLRCLHSQVADEVLAMCAAETAVQLSLFA